MLRRSWRPGFVLTAVLLGCGCAGDLVDLDGGALDTRAVTDAATDGVGDSQLDPDLRSDTAPPWELGTFDGGGTTPCHTSTCKTSTEVCVRTNLQTTFSYACKPVTQPCLAHRSCACLASYVCTLAHPSCAEGPPGSNLVVCF